MTRVVESREIGMAYRLVIFTVREEKEKRLDWDAIYAKNDIAKELQCCCVVWL